MSVTLACVVSVGFYRENTAGHTSELCYGNVSTWEMRTEPKIVSVPIYVEQNDNTKEKCVFKCAIVPKQQKSVCHQIKV